MYSSNDISADEVFQKLGELFEELRTEQRRRLPNETDEDYQKRQKQIIDAATSLPELSRSEYEHLWKESK